MGEEEHSTKRVRLVTAGSKDLLHQTVGHSFWSVGPGFKEVSSNSLPLPLGGVGAIEASLKIWNENKTQELEGKAVWRVEWHAKRKGLETGPGKPKDFLTELLPLSSLLRPCTLANTPLSPL